MSDIQLFDFQGHDVRITDREGNPWFVGKDVCDTAEVDRSQLRRLDDDEKDMCIIHTLGGDQEMTIISESGVYSLGAYAMILEVLAKAEPVLAGLLDNATLTRQDLVRHVLALIESAYAQGWDEAQPATHDGDPDDPGQLGIL